MLFVLERVKLLQKLLNHSWAKPWDERTKHPHDKTSPAAWEFLILMNFGICPKLESNQHSLLALCGRKSLPNLRLKSKLSGWGIMCVSRLHRVFFGPTWKVLTCICCLAMMPSSSSSANILSFLCLCVIETCGTSTPYMQAAFPSKTFPNHYTIVTVIQSNSSTHAGNHETCVCVHVSDSCLVHRPCSPFTINKCCYDRTIAPVCETV